MATPEELEIVTNDYLDVIRELEYKLVHFIKKTNKSTALDVRNVARDVNKKQADFKKISIAFYKDNVE
jgi:hypothetical protein